MTFKEDFVQTVKVQEQFSSGESFLKTGFSLVGQCSEQCFPSQSDWTCFLHKFEGLRWCPVVYGHEEVMYLTKGEYHSQRK